ncbi:tail collar fiber protein [Klebsiella phage KP179]|uniref:Straight tail fiber n=1 Tax=Klebsiella phage KP179 TaxID=2315700 RepID=A0A386K753_9CAUD|nr:tail collar fiber protein [Klebsiella phage KP179]AYD80727.1 straight tail fiber [Klebsiella phage KP179]
MAQNNYNHYSDLAKYTIFDPANTQWPVATKDVQSALALIGSWARTDTGLPAASPTVAGIIRTATQAEVEAGTVGNAAVTPATLKSTITRPEATTAILGLTRYATNTEAAALTAANRTITAAALGHVFKTVKAQENVDGTVRLTTAAQAQAGTDETTAVTPKRVVEMIGKFSVNPPTYTSATESNLGLVRVATQAQVAAGVVHDGYAVTPKTFMASKASDSVFGIVKFAKDSDVTTATANNLAVTPKSLQALKSTKDKYGLTRLSGSPTSDASLAAAATDAVFKTRKINGKTLDNDITITNNDINCYTRPESDGRYMPAGTRVGNITWVEGGTYIPAGNWFGCNSPYEATSRLALTLTIKFQRNNDGYDNRIWRFRITVNGENRGEHTLNIENTKGGRNGHSWRFEGYATGSYIINDVPPNARVQIEPFENIRGDNYSASLTFCTNR